jgi:hypothetical protein
MNYFCNSLPPEIATLLKVIIINPQNLYSGSGVVRYIDRAVVKYKILIVLALSILIKSLLNDTYRMRLSAPLFTPDVPAL